jgi:hypothetical protein
MRHYPTKPKAYTMKLSKLNKEFSFAGFSFPKHVFTLPRGAMAKRANDRKSNFGIGAYYHAPKPNSKAGISFYLDSDFMPGLRYQFCDEVSSRIRHTGWYADNFRDTKIRGLVFRLPHNKGFLIGWTMGKGMASGIDTDQIFDDEIDAAYAADSLAESIAEKERQFQEDHANDDE